jgi:hypothetical protein
VDALNSADPAVRLATLEEAAASKDQNLRRIALTTAFASSDSILRGAALTAAVSTAATFIVDLAKNDGEKKNRIYELMLGSFEVRITEFDELHNTFFTHTSYSYIDNKNKPLAKPAAVSGDRLSFTVDTFKISGDCKGVARLEGNTGKLVGTMACSYDSETYKISIDILQ